MAVEQKEKLAHRLFRKLQGRERLQGLAAAAQPSKENPELERLKAYLLDWSLHQAEVWRKTNGSHSQSTLAQFMKSDGQSAIKHLDSSYAWAFSLIDAALDDLLALKEGVLMRAAIRVRYLNEGIDPGGERKIRVFRSNRLQLISIEEVDRLADDGENSLISIVKRRGLPL